MQQLGAINSHNKKVTGILFIVATSCYLSGCTYPNTNPERTIVDTILSDYSESIRYSRPVVNASRSVWVTFGLVVNRVIKFEEKKELLTVLGWSRLVWHDEYLPWNMTTSGVTSVRIPAKKLWTPDVHSYNGIEKTLYEPYVVLNADGLALWVVQKEYGFPCIRNPNNDIEWTCRLRVSSATHDTSRLALHSMWHSVDLSSYEGHGHVTITTTSADRDDTVWPCCAQPYPSASVVFVIVINVT